MALHIYKVQLQLNNRTQLSPVMVGSYLDCRHVLAEEWGKAQEKEMDEVALMGPRRMPSGFEHLGAASWYDAEHEEAVTLFIRAVAV